MVPVACGADPSDSALLRKKIGAHVARSIRCKHVPERAKGRSMPHRAKQKRGGGRRLAHLIASIIGDAGGALLALCPVRTAVHGTKQLQHTSPGTLSRVALAIRSSQLGQASSVPWHCSWGTNHTRSMAGQPLHPLTYHAARHHARLHHLISVASSYLCESTRVQMPAAALYDDMM